MLFLCLCYGLNYNLLLLKTIFMLILYAHTKLISITSNLFSHTFFFFYSLKIDYYVQNLIVM